MIASLIPVFNPVLNSYVDELSVEFEATIVSLFVRLNGNYFEGFSAGAHAPSSIFMGLRPF